MPVIIPDKLYYIGHPRTYVEEVCSSLLRKYPNARYVIDESYLTELPDKRVTSIRSPFALCKQWFDVNPEWKARGFLDFINNYNHSHYMRNGSLFWYCQLHDCDIVRDEDVQDSLEEVLGEGIDLGTLLPIPDYREFYGPDELEAAQTRFAFDLENFNYEF